jgi:RNA-binding protein
MQLTPSQRKALMARSHALEPRVRVGQKGLTPAVIAEAARNLDQAPLMKVHCAGDRDQRHALATALAEALRATLVSEVGRVALLYRVPLDCDAAAEFDGEE